MEHFASGKAAPGLVDPENWTLGVVEGGYPACATYGSMAASRRSAASSSRPSKRCPYVSSVVVIDA